MINKLTDTQIALFPEYVDRWLKIGLSIETNEAKAEEAISKVYECAGKQPPKIIIWLDSPFQGVIAAHLLSGSKIAGAQVWAQVRDQVWAQVRDQVWDQVNRSGYGSHDANWLSFYSYMKEVLNLNCCDKLAGLTDLAYHCGWFWPFEGAVVLTRKLIKISLKNKRLHEDGGPAIQYRDGFAVYALNGIRVSKEIAETSGETLSCQYVLTEKNAEIRREIVRKIGVERIYKELGGKTLDTMDSYELISLNLGDDRHRPYLKMVNPSIQTIHIEGVHPDCKTVKDALAWRSGQTGKFVPPAILT